MRRAVAVDLTVFTLALLVLLTRAKQPDDVYELVLEKHNNLAGFIVLATFVVVLCLIVLCVVVGVLSSRIRQVRDMLPQMQSVLTIAKEYQELNRRTASTALHTLKEVRDVERGAATHVARSAQTLEVIHKDTRETKQDVKELKAETPSGTIPPEVVAQLPKLRPQ